jgi:hypothetical protein
MRVPTKLRIAKTEAEAMGEEIRCRAYELYEQRGREDGHQLEDWLRAEAEVTCRTERTAA